MHIYKLAPSFSEHLTDRNQLSELSGKFLYFSHNDSLIVAADPDIFHKNIYEFAKSSQLVSDDHHPNGYGKLHHGKVESWKSNYFGETPEDMKRIITDRLESFHK